MKNELTNLLNYINEAKGELKISCNDGSVYINTSTLDFTYVGKFGNQVLMHCIKMQAVNNTAIKLMVLAAHMDVYSSKIGGFTIS